MCFVAQYKQTDNIYIYIYDVAVCTAQTKFMNASLEPLSILLCDAVITTGLFRSFNIANPLFISRLFNG